MRPRSLSVRLLVWILPISIAGTLAISVSTYFIARGVILWQARRGVAAVTAAAAAQAQSYFEQRDGELSTIAQSPLFRDYYMNTEFGLRHEAEIYRREIEKTLADLSERTRAYPGLGYIDASGRKIAVVRGGKVVVPNKILQAKAFYDAVMKLKPGSSLVSDTVQVPWDRERAVLYGTPVVDEKGRPRGALIFAVSLGPVRQALEKLGKGLGASGSMRLAARSAKIDARSSGGDLLTASAPITGTEWRVEASVERGDFIDRLAWVSGLTFLITLLGTSVLVVVLTGQVRRQLQPLRELAGAAEAYAAGDLSVRVPAAGPAEVSALAESFDAMADKIESRTRALTESEARYRTAMENSPNAVVGLDQNRRVTFWNRRAEAIFGYQPTEAAGHSLALVFDQETYEKLNRQVETEGSIRQSEVQGKSRDGRILDISISWTGQLAGSGGAREWFVVMQDVTEKKRLQAQLMQAEKMTAIGSLIAGVAHELNNPLAAVTGFAELLKDLPAKAEEKEDLRLLYESALRCRDIVQSLLHFVRQGKAAPQRLSLNAVVKSTLTLFEYRLIKTEAVALEIALDPAVPQLAGEFQKVQQVLVNLLGNACDALKGRIGRRVIRVRTFARLEGSTVEIEDNGPGVSPERRAQIFEPFHTTKPAGQGTGLGLPISKQIVAEFGGDLRYEDAPGGGARFTATFPPCPPDLPEVEAAPALPLATPGRRVLVVDDEPQLVSLMLRLLHEDGLVAASENGRASILRRIQNEKFDLVITDIDLGPFKGTDLMKDARALSGSPAFIFVTGDVLNRPLAEELSELGIPVLAKPFLRTEFLRIVRRVLSERSGVA